MRREEWHGTTSPAAAAQEGQIEQIETDEKNEWRRRGQEQRREGEEKRGDRSVGAPPTGRPERWRIEP